MDKVIDEEKEFIQNFALELTNRTLEERKEIGKKYYKQQKDLLDIQYKLVQALQEIRDIILSPEIIDEETKKLHTSEELDNIVRWHREDKLSKIKDKINEVIGAEE